MICSFFVGWLVCFGFARGCFVLSEEEESFLIKTAFHEGFDASSSADGQLCWQFDLLGAPHGAHTHACTLRVDRGDAGERTRCFVLVYYFVFVFCLLS